MPPKRILVPNVPEESSFKLIGLGGVGLRVGEDLATFLASLNVDARLVLIDGDQYEPSNATRMRVPGYGNKAAALRAALLPHFTSSRLLIEAIEEFVSPENIHRLLHNGDTVVLALDNHASRKLVSDFCSTLQDVCLISGGNDGVGKDSSGHELRGTYGNVQVYLRRGGVDLTPSLTKHHPEIANPVDRLPTDQSCMEHYSSQPQLLVTNRMTATAVLSAIWLHLCGALHFSELAFDVQDALMRPAPPWE
jgi:molybdopterin/thiamine biosynthesis adenylyltransferase